MGSTSRPRGSKRKPVATAPIAASGRSSGPASASPTPRSKQAAWERINGQGYGSDYLTRAAIAGFQWLHQRDILRALPGALL